MEITTVPVALISTNRLEHCTKILPANIEFEATVQQFREHLASALLGEDKRLLKLTFKVAEVDDSAMLYSYAADDAAAPRFVASCRQAPPADGPLGRILCSGTVWKEIDTGVTANTDRVQFTHS